MTINLRFLPPIPKGMRIMEADVEIAGLRHRVGYAKAFARRREHSLELEREPSNPHDPNAIKVIGHCKGWFFRASIFLGYIPRDTAERIANRKLWGKIVPRLKNIWAGGYVKDVVTIRLDILEPKPEKEPRAKRIK